MAENGWEWLGWTLVGCDRAPNGTLQIASVTPAVPDGWLTDATETVEAARLLARVHALVQVRSYWRRRAARPQVRCVISRWDGRLPPLWTRGGVE